MGIKKKKKLPLVGNNRKHSHLEFYSLMEEFLQKVENNLTGETLSEKDWERLEVKRAGYTFSFKNHFDDLVVTATMIADGSIVLDRGFDTLDLYFSNIQEWQW